MRVIPVIDLKAGQAVHAIAGERAHYRPVLSSLHAGSSPLGLALAYQSALGLSEIYLADLDAIAGAPPSLALYETLAASGFALWVDAGVRDSCTLEPLLDSGAATIVAGLETLLGPNALVEAIEAAGPERLAFSLDLRNGQPVFSQEADWGTSDAIAIAETAVRAGLRRIVLLDLARVGTGAGTGTRELLLRLVAAFPQLELAVGGGIAGPDELAALERAGASAALVGSALHDGRITADECRRFCS
ncbi:MAG TPA: HisA/HisF-related TIM barrel protein [Isosphaeraceae bacterium]|jgi:phosphoribosylformimino-5-aminoimidazole carboxamide ribotide isomerase|nr:HisA/HisF-related TIM barrel protein [Isosphaeraceae bacterium]